MSLEEFFTNESMYTNFTIYLIQVLTFIGYGKQNWADDDIDMASIAVPTGNIHPSYHHYNNNDGFNNYSLGRGGNQSMPDLGPPYIVKLLHLPITVNEGFIEDLFRSRYTTFVKFKIAVDPASNILETRVIKKVAFVELANFGDFQKVSKWQDLYYKQNRRVVIEMADFQDFKMTIKFNEEHQREIAAIEGDFNSGKINPRFQDGIGGGMAGQGHADRFAPRLGGPDNSQPRLGNQPALQAPKLQKSHIETQTLKPKSNPFGNAKPVDTSSKQQEIEKKLINLNKTTVQTLGDDIEKVDVETTIKKFHESASPRHSRGSFESRRPSFSILKRQVDFTANLNNPTNTVNSPVNQIEEKEINQPKPLPQTKAPISIVAEEPSTKKLSPAPVPEFVYLQNANGKSLAELLAKKPDANANGKGYKTNAKKPSPKPIILKKKVAPQPDVDLTRKESDLLAEEEYRKRDEALRKIENERRKALEEETKRKRKEEGAKKKLELEDKLKLINDSLSKAEIRETTKFEKNQKSDANNLPQPTTSTTPLGDRPDFKKRLDEIVTKREKVVSQEAQNKTESSEYSSRGGYNGRGGYNNRGRYYKGAQYDNGYNNGYSNSNNNYQKDNGSTDKARSYKERRDIKTEADQTKIDGTSYLDQRDGNSKLPQSSTAKYPGSNRSKFFNRKDESTTPQDNESKVPKKFQNVVTENKVIPNSEETSNPTKESSAIPKKFQNVERKNKNKTPPTTKPRQQKKEKYQKQPKNTTKESQKASAESIEPSAPKEVQAPDESAKVVVPEQLAISNNEVNESRKSSDETSTKGVSEENQSVSGGRGRGGHRGNYRGRYSNRGRGRGSPRGTPVNFNLSYVRPKAADSPTSAP